MGKKGILLVSFGTVDFMTRKKCIYSIEKNIKKLYDDFEVYSAFTSRFIVKKLKSMGESVLSIDDAFNSIFKMDFDEVIVQPTLITDGEEYKRLVFELEKYEKDIKISVGKPILYYDEDYNKVAEILINEVGERKNFINLFMGHGNKKYDGRDYFKVQKKLIEKGRCDIFIATVEGEPSFEKFLKNISPKDNVFLQPMMITAGEHAKNDMAGECNKSFKNRLIKKGCNVEYKIKGLGEIEEISMIISEHINKVDRR